MYVVDVYKNQPLDGLEEATTIEEAKLQIESKMLSDRVGLFKIRDIVDIHS